MSGEHARLGALEARLGAVEKEHGTQRRVLAAVLADLATVEDATDRLAERLNAGEPDPEPDPGQPDDSESGNNQPAEPPQIFYEIEYRADTDSLWCVATEPMSPYANVDEALIRINDVLRPNMIAEFRIVKVTRETVT